MAGRTVFQVEVGHVEIVKDGEAHIISLVKNLDARREEYVMMVRRARILILVGWITSRVTGTGMLAILCGNMPH